MGKWCLYLAAAASLHATSLYWSAISAAPSSLPLDRATALNNSGIAVGSAGGQAAEASVNSIGLIALGLPGNSVAASINDSGQIAGAWSDSLGYQHAFYWSSTSGALSLGTLGGSMSVATAINGSGQVVGQTLDASGNLAAFVWTQGGGMSRIGDSSSQNAVAINNSGQVAYQEDPPPFQTQYGALGGASDLSILNFSGLGSVISAMNNQGWVVGQTNGQGFLWTPTFSLNFGSSFLPTSINDSGVVIGSYLGQPAVWTQSAGFQLLDLGGYSGVSLADINNNGQIVGNTTAPEPAAPLLCLAGLFLLAAGWRRRSLQRSQVIAVTHHHGGRHQHK